MNQDTIVLPRNAGGNTYNPYTGEPCSEAEAERLIREATPTAEEQAQLEEAYNTFYGTTKGRRVEFDTLTDVPLIPQEFVIDPFLPLGTLTVYGGYGGVKKTMFLLWQAAALTMGMAEGKFKGEPVNVVYIGREDSRSVLKFRALAAGVDLKRFHCPRLMDDSTGNDVEQGLVLPDDMSVLEDYVDYTHAKLLIIDPIESVIAGKLNDLRTVRKALDPLEEFAQRRNIAVLMIGHFSTSGRLTGSEGFRDIVRSKLDFAEDKDAGDIVVQLDKSQYSACAGKAWSFTVETVPVPDCNGVPRDTPRVRPSSFMPTDRSVTELLARELNKFRQSESKSVNAEVTEWLTDVLADGPLPASEVLKAGAEQGFSNKAINNARNRAKNPKIIAFPDPEHTGRGRSMIWKLDSTKIGSEND